MNLQRSLPYLLIGTLTLAGIGLTEYMARQQLLAAQARFVEDARRETRVAASAIEHAMEELHHTLRTIASLPSVRRFERSAAELPEDARATIVELQRALALNIRVRGLHLIPGDFAVGELDPLTRKPFGPVESFEVLTRGDGGAEKALGSASYAPALQDQVRSLAASSRVVSFAGRGEYPAYSRRFRLGGKAEAGITLFAVPVYAPDGRMHASVTAVLDDAAIAALIAARSATLHRPGSNGASALAGTTTAGSAKSGTIYRESRALPIPDLAGAWTLAAERGAEEFRASADAGNVRRTAWFAQILFLLAGVGGVFGVRFARLRRELTQAHARSLEHIVQQRTAELKHALEEVLETRRAAEEASRVRGRFMERLSGEIRTPMTGLIGMVDVLRASQLDTRQRQIADMVHSSANSLIGIVNDIIDYTRMSADQVALETVDFEFGDLVEDAVAEASREAVARGVEVIVDLASELPARVAADPTRLRQILANLVTNAAKFTERGEIVISAKPRRDSDGSIIDFTVRDTGIGIAKERLALLLDAAAGAERDATEGGRGTGLGVAIVQRLVRLMGGQITLDSELGRGTTFRFDIRVVPRSTPVADAPPNPLAARNVLVMLAHAIARGALTARLRTAGLVVTAIDSVAQIESALANGAYAALIADEHAAATLARLRERSSAGPAGVLVPPIALVRAAGSSTQGTDLAGEEGNALLERPIRRALLLGMLAQRCAAHAAAAARPAAAGTPATSKVAALEFSGGFGPDETELAQPEAQSTVANVPAEPVPPRARSVLVVEDNAINVQVASHMLERMGCLVLVAQDGREACDVWTLNGFDLILMDCQMPVMDGYQAATEIRKREQRAGNVRRVPIVAMSAHDSARDRQQALDAGMDDALPKPFTVAQMEAVLERWAGAGRPASARRTTEDANRLLSLPATSLRAPSPEPAGEASAPDPSDRPRRKAMIQRYRRDSVAVLARVRLALAQDDAAGFRRGLETLRELSEAMGGERLAAHCAALAAQGPPSGSAGPDLSALDTLLADHRDLLNALVRAYRGSAADGASESPAAPDGAVLVQGGR